MVGDIMQPTHLIFVLVVALLVLGPKRLPEVGRQLGNGLRDFRAAINGERTERHDEVTRPTNAAEDDLSSASGETPAPYEFAHDSAETTADQHQFAHDSVETTADQHQFAHDSVENTVDEHEFARESTESVGGSGATGDASKPAGEHAFAYKTSEPAETPADPNS
jgi:sec-independent protein translocase protein TatA